MSRNIEPKQSLSFTVEDQLLNQTSEGKLIFTKAFQQPAAFLVQDNRLKCVSFYSATKLGNCYLAKIKNIVPNIEACFVEIKDKEICFLPLKELAGITPRNRLFDGRFKEGDEIPVQVTRDAQKTKQASVSSHINITGRFFSFTLGERGVFLSKKFDEDERQNILTELIHRNVLFDEKTLVDSFVQQENYSFSCIIRTDARMLLSDPEQVISEFHNLVAQCKALINTIQHVSCFSLIMEGASQHFEQLEHQIKQSEYNEIVTDLPEVYNQLSTIQTKAFAKPLRLYSDELLSLSKLYALDAKLDMALGARIWLKSGAYLIIEPTEALTVIDVNSGKYETKKNTPEDYLLQVNKEAAKEVAAQLRLRNLSGIIVVDFINMDSKVHRQELLEHLKKYVSQDPIPTKVIDMTPLGLIEITRKKIEKTLREQVQYMKRNQVQ